MAATAAQAAAISAALALPRTRAHRERTLGALRRIKDWVVENRLTDRYLKSLLLEWRPLLEPLLDRDECRPAVVSLLKALVVVRPHVAVDVLEELVTPLMAWTLLPDRMYSTISSTLLLTAARCSAHPGLISPIIAILRQSLPLVPEDDSGHIEELEGTMGKGALTVIPPSQGGVVEQHAAWLLSEMLTVVAVEWMGGYWGEVEEGIGLCLEHPDGIVGNLGRKSLGVYAGLRPEEASRFAASLRRRARILPTPLALGEGMTDGNSVEWEPMPHTAALDDMPGSLPVPSIPETMLECQEEPPSPRKKKEFGHVRRWTMIIPPNIRLGS